MLSMVYCYVSIQHRSPIEEEKELRDLLFDMKTLCYYDHYISDIVVDNANKRVVVNVNVEGYNYLLKKAPDSYDIKIQNVIYYTNAYKFNRGL